jgi:hypothetical protein
VDTSPLDFNEVFDQDYLHLYGLRRDESDGEADPVWRLLELVEGTTPQSGG